MGLGNIVKGLLGGGKGVGFNAVAPTKQQLDQTFTNTQNQVGQQNAFVQALQAQGGIGNQSNVFQQQQALANQLQGVANGTGPNPALAALNQATGQNVANQAALMAGQRGASANTGMMARQAAQQGGNLQQQAVGQGATLQAQQQLAAMNQLGQQQQAMGQLASQQVGQQGQAMGQANQLALGQQQNVMGLQQNANSTNAQIAAQAGQGQMNLLGGLMGAAGTALAGPLGGMAAGLFSQGAKSPTSVPTATPGSLGGAASNNFAQGGPVQSGPRSMYGKSMLAKGGPVKALVSPGEVYLPPSKVEKVAKGKASPMSGEKIPGKPKVGGAKNSYANDTVDKTLQEGGIVIPRSITQGKNPEKAAADFVAAVLKKQPVRKG